MNRDLRFQNVFELQVSPKITSDEISQALQRLYDACGCPTCGLGGLDLNIRVLPPELGITGLQEINKFDNVFGINIRERGGF
jgi:hypothetical protein